ncbi:MAG: hypothetical protein ABI740_11350, partial [Alphaproteobacteria bacterium]
MQATTHSFRNRVSGLALGLALAFGGVAVTSVTAPAAVAQQKSTKEFVEAYREGKEAVAAKEWNKVISSADKASSYAKEKAEKMAVINLRISGYSGLRKTPELIKTIEEQLALGGLSGDQVRAQRTSLAGYYAEVHNDAKAVELTKA